MNGPCVSGSRKAPIYRIVVYKRSLCMRYEISEYEMLSDIHADMSDVLNTMTNVFS